MARSILVVGTASGVGKSFIATALCRILRNRGLRVAPFKAQNMSNNAAVCPGGGEIARSQAAQAEACGLEPTVDMNPLLLKPESGWGFQVVLQGRAIGSMTPETYRERKPAIVDAVRASLDRMREAHDLLVMEGAGSCAEINLRDDDIANMRLAEWADASALLVGDIDRGGVFAHLVGTMELVESRGRIRGFVINKFRGRRELLDPGLRELEERTSTPVLGVIPHMTHSVPAEDALDLEDGGRGRLKVSVLKLPTISNFDEFEPLKREPDVELRFVETPREPPDLLILPGSKSSAEDLEWVRRTGLADWVLESHARGSLVMGICGGYQMLGSSVSGTDGLRLIRMDTTFEPEKVTQRVRGIEASTRAPVEGYEIHTGRSERPALPPLLVLEGREEGVRTEGIIGTYVHGLFEGAPFRRTLLNELRARRGWTPLEVTDSPRDWDSLAAAVEPHLDMKAILKMVGR